MRDKSLTKPSGISGDEKPYPVKTWEWTRAEFSRFLVEYRYPPNTFGDRLENHRRAVIDAIYRGETVSPEVLADYPDVPE